MADHRRMCDLKRALQDSIDIIFEFEFILKEKEESVLYESS